AAPTPGTISAHEQNFTVSIRPSDEQRQTAATAAHRRVDGENISARATLNDASAPIKTWQTLPNALVAILIHGKQREEMTPAGAGEEKVGFISGSHAVRFFLVVDHRQEVFERSAQ